MGGGFDVVSTEQRTVCKTVIPALLSAQPTLLRIASSPRWRRGQGSCCRLGRLGRLLGQRAVGAGGVVVALLVERAGLLGDGGAHAVADLALGLGERQRLLQTRACLLQQLQPPRALTVGNLVDAALCIAQQLCVCVCVWEGVQGGGWRGDGGGRGKGSGRAGQGRGEGEGWMRGRGVLASPPLRARHGPSTPHQLEQAMSVSRKREKARCRSTGSASLASANAARYDADMPRLRAWVARR